MVAVDSNRLSNVVGYDLRPGEFNQVTPNLPQRIVILGQPNSANEADITENEVKEYSLLKPVGDRYGYGSPIYNAMRILRPQSGTGVGSVKTIIIPQKASSSATKKKLNVEPTGTASANATHTLVINGRRGIGAARYDFTIVKGEGPAAIAQKLVDTVNNALAAPVTGTLDTTVSSTESLLAETKFAGKIADELNIEVDTNDQPAGISYSVTEDQAGGGVPTIQPALDKFVEWNTIVINPYGTDVHSTLEDFNGKPSEYGGTGRYSPTVFKPFVALFGNRDGDTTIDFSNQKEEVTNVVCPAPNSPNFNHEVAASYARLLSVTAQNTPHLDIQGRKLPDITTGETAGKFSDYNFRDAAVKRGWSTAEIDAGAYVVRDFVTTYHPDGEQPLQFNHVRNLIIDWNIRFRYYLLEETFVTGKAIATNGTFVQASDVIKPKQWKAQLAEFAEDLGADGLISDPAFFKANTEVTIDDTNPDRLNTEIKYKRTGFARILSTTASAGFALG
jgi:phage tail sheath gpL-like